MDPTEDWKEDVEEAAYELGWEDGYWDENENPFEPGTLDYDDYNTGQHDVRNP